MYSPLPISRRSLATSWGAGLGDTQQLLQKINIVTRNAPPLYFSQLLLLSTCHVMGNIPGVSCPGCLSSQDPAQPQPTGEEGTWRQPCCWASTAQQQPKHWGFYQHIFSSQGTVQQCEGCSGEVNFISDRPSALLHQPLLMNRSPVYHLNEFLCMNIPLLKIFFCLTIHVEINFL